MLAIALAGALSLSAQRQLFTNNGSSTLASSITNVATSLAVQSGHGARFPTITGADFFYVTIEEGDPVTAREIVKVTARSTDTFTIVRAQESTTGTAFSAGATVALRATAGTFNNFMQTTRINGSSGAAGGDLTLQKLSSNCGANSTTTLATCMTTTGVTAGTWTFKYTVLYQAAATTTGVNFAINHTGTVTKMVASGWFNTSGGAAATALADQVSSDTASLAEGKSARALNTKFGSTLGVDTANADMLYIIEGLIIVTASGSLELRHASEVAAASTVMAETSLELRKIG